MKFFKPKFWDENKISFFSIFFYPLAFLIKILTFLKKLLTEEKKNSIPVICVGNIYLGGTGKTPLCIEIFYILKNLNQNPVFIRKKYKNFQDEINLLSKVGKVYENNKRAIAINRAIENKATVAILDDGFQDFSIKKDLSIICFNEKQWIGNGLTIPSGPLRENLSALKRSECVIINGKRNTNIEKIILKKNDQIKILYSSYELENFEKFKNKKIISFAGIGNPINFFNLLKDKNLNLIEEISFPDHYNYSSEELENLIEKANNTKAVLLTTEKDYNRIHDNYKNKINFLKIKMNVENKKELIDEIKKII